MDMVWDMVASSMGKDRREMASEDTMEDTDLDMVLDTGATAMLTTMARDPLMPNPKLKPNLDICMEDMEVMVSDMEVIMAVDMEVMVSDSDIEEMDMVMV